MNLSTLPSEALVDELLGQQQVVVKIEETDKDGDSVLDKDDQCPNLLLSRRRLCWLNFS